MRISTIIEKLRKSKEKGVKEVIVFFIDDSQINEAIKSAKEKYNIEIVNSKDYENGIGNFSAKFDKAIKVAF